MAHEAANDLNLPVMIRHLAYTDQEARQFAGSLGLEPGTAKDVAKKAGIEIDWEMVYRIIDGPGERTSHSSNSDCCPTTPSAKWTPELDLALRPCEEKALSVGIMMTPVIVISGRIYHQGSVPSKEQVRQWIGEAFKTETEAKPVTLEVLGPGCHNCESVYQNVFKALDMAGLRERVHVKKMTDLNYFMEKGVYVTPALVIDGKVISKGKVLNPGQILDMLKGEIRA
jgi:small redox-active disulfide protein 2